MATPNTTQPLKVGTLVRVRNSGYRKARIVDFLGPLGPGGTRIYRVRVRRKPHPAYAEFREDQLEPIQAEA